jgi:hypothetical protein
MDCERELLCEGDPDCVSVCDCDEVTDCEGLCVPEGVMLQVKLRAANYRLGGIKVLRLMQKR